MEAVRLDCSISESDETQGLCVQFCMESIYGKILLQRVRSKA